MISLSKTSNDMSNSAANGMDKQQTIHSFWSSFGITAYDENSVPDDAQMPYITYNVSTADIGDIVIMSASVWYRTNSWTYLDNMANRISNFIGYGGKTIPLDKGMVWIKRSSPFAQRMADDGEVKRMLLQISVEYITQD